MRDPLDFIDAGATDDEPVKGVVQGNLRDWHDAIAERDSLKQQMAVMRPLSKVREEGFARCRDERDALKAALERIANLKPFEPKGDSAADLARAALTPRQP